MSKPHDLDYYIEKSGLKISFITETLGISHAGFAKKRKSLTKWRGAEVYTLTHLLNIPNEDVERIFFA